MGVSYNGRIVTDGLVLCLDAANTRSYPGSGTTWTDLSTTGASGVLTNGPTFDAANGGSIVFDGTDDRIAINSINIGTVYTCFIWVNFDAFTGGVLAGHQAWNNGGYIFWVSNNDTIYHANSGGYDFITGFNLSVGQWYLLTNVRNGTSVSMYKDGNLVGSLTAGATANTLSSIGAYNNNGFPLNGNISNFSLYNRALTADEVQNNYNALRGRFK